MMEFDVKVNFKDMYRFNLYQAYTSSEGWLGFLMAAVAFVAAKLTYGTVGKEYTTIYILFGVALLFYVPVTLMIRVKGTLASNRVLRGTLHYRFDEKGLTVSQDGDVGELPWVKIYKLVATKHNVLVYNSRITAYVIPREQLTEEQFKELKRIIYKNLPGFRVTMKRS